MRERRVQRVPRAVTVRGRKCDSAARKRDKPIQRDDGRRKEKQPRCVSSVCAIAGVYVSEWLGEKREGSVRREQPRLSDVTAL